jgi:hypothetical protein
MSSQGFFQQMSKAAAMFTAGGETLIQRVNDHVGESIRVGSPVTGAPGQPVKTGALLASWVRVQSGPHAVQFYSGLPYASVIEHNLRGAQLRSAVGGFHSVKLTKNGFLNIVNHELSLMAGGVYDPRGRGSQVRNIKTGRWM